MAIDTAICKRTRYVDRTAGNGENRSGTDTSFAAPLNGEGSIAGNGQRFRRRIKIAATNAIGAVLDCDRVVAL